MSLVTNVLVSVDSCENNDNQKRLCEITTTTSVGQTLRAITGPDPVSGEYVQACEGWGGSKYPECSLYAAAFNYLEWGEFKAAIEAIPWTSGDFVQVLVNGQEDKMFSVWVLRGKQLECVFQTERW